MSFEPFGWSVVIVGHWNPAILTPAGIAKRVFGIDPGRSLQVMVPLDGISRYVVKHPNDRIQATADDRHLKIDLLTCDYEALEDAMQAGVEALESLPETPVFAAGLNVDFRTTQGTDPVAETLATTLAGNIDAPLSDQGYRIVGRTLIRSLEWHGGVLNMTIVSQEDGYSVRHNFHRGSQDRNDLVQWLKTPIGDIKTEVKNLAACLSLEFGEEPDDDDRE